MKFLTTRFVIVDWGIIQEHALERLLVAKGTFWMHPDITTRRTWPTSSEWRLCSRVHDRQGNFSWLQLERRGGSV